MLYRNEESSNASHCSHVHLEPVCPLFWGWFSPKGLFLPIKTRAGWWFQTFFIFTFTWGNDPIWRANIFSRGWFNHQQRGAPFGFQAWKPHNLVLNYTGRVSVYPYCWWLVQKSGLGDHQLRLVVYPIIYDEFYNVLAPSQVVVGDFFHQQHVFDS